MKLLQRISAAATAVALSAGAAPALVGTTTATAVLASGTVLTAPAAEAKEHKKGGIYQAFAGPRNATRTQLRARSKQALHKKVRKFCSSQAGDCYATDRIQQIKDGASNWDTLAPWRRYGTPSTDKNGDNLYFLPQH